MINVLLFSGGRGSLGLARELIKNNNIHLTQVVNAFDDGKSTGEIREFFEMLGPSDIRKSQINLMADNHPQKGDLTKIFEYRYPHNVKYSVVVKDMLEFINTDKNQIMDIELNDKFYLEIVKNLLKSFYYTLSLYEKALSKKFNFSDCSLANCLYAGAFEIFKRDFDVMINFFNVLLRLNGDVISTTSENKKLIAIRESGEILSSEEEIVELRSNVRVKDIFLVDNIIDKNRIESNLKNLSERYNYLKTLEKNVHASNKLLHIIDTADIIIYGPGTQHSSLYPTYVTKGIAESIQNNNNALKFLITNIGEDYEIPNYSASEIISSSYKYLTKFSEKFIPIDELINYAMINTGRNQTKPELKYVQYDINDLEKLNIKLLLDNYEDAANLGKHDSSKIIKIILDKFYSKYFTQLRNG